MSFKYRFILSFVLIEIFIIVLIVSVNFFTISNGSKKLIDEKIESNITFLEELIRVPVSIYDIATLDDLVKSSTNYMNSLVILDKNDKVLSSHYLYKDLTQEELIKLKSSKSIKKNKKSYEIIYKKLLDDDVIVGSMYVIFDTSSSSEFIESNKIQTIIIIIIGILLSIIISYIIGYNLTKKLTKLSVIAYKIGKNIKIDIPFRNYKNEIGMLAKSMFIMQENLLTRKNEQKEYTNALRIQKQELIQANKSKDDFLANMSHELKTPLNSINVISDVMMRNRTENLDEKQLKNLGIINKCGKDLLFLINDVLDISKLEAGQIILNNETLNVKDLMMNIYDMFYPQTKAKNIDFVLKIDDNLGTIYSDEDRIKQVVKNLLSNALKFTSEGKISLIVKDEDKNIKVIVKDEGIGIPEDKLENIFDRFKQVDGSTTRKYGGTGLGLAICKELAHLLKGDISVSSEIDKGSTFELIICKNSDMIQGLEILSLERTEEKSISTIDHDKEKTPEKEPNDEIYILNSDPILFFKIISQISSKYNITYIKDLKEIDLSKNKKIILEFSSLKEEDIAYIKENKIKNLLLITESNVNIDEELRAFVSLFIDKSLNNFDYSLI